MLVFGSSTANCGVSGLSGFWDLRDKKQVPEWLILMRNNAVLNYKIIYFSDKIKEFDGKAWIFAEYIQENNLGQLITHEPVANVVHPERDGQPSIQFWVWLPDWDAIKKVTDTEAEARIKRYAEIKAQAEAEARRLREEREKRREEENKKALAKAAAALAEANAAKMQKSQAKGMR